MVGNPQLAFRSIEEHNNHPIVLTDADGRFRFENVKLGEYVLTVEARGYAPEQRPIRLESRPHPLSFTLQPGRRVRNRIVDTDGEPIAGACVVLNRWHCHTDAAGVFHWRVESPMPEDVTLQVYKRYSGEYEKLEQSVPLAQMESEPIPLKRR